MSHLEIKRNCVVCNKEFITKSSKGIYCSKICYKRNWRKKQKENSMVIPKEKPVITKENLESKHYLTIKECIIYFEISENIIRRKIRKNNLKPIKFKNKHLFLKSSFSGDIWRSIDYLKLYRFFTSI